MPATSQLDWLISMTAMIVLFWSRATRDLLKSFGWGIAGTPSIRCTRRSCHFLAARPIASIGPSRTTDTRIGLKRDRQSFVRKVSRDACATVKCSGGAVIREVLSGWFWFFVLAARLNRKLTAPYRVGG